MMQIIVYLLFTEIKENIIYLISTSIYLLINDWLGSEFIQFYPLALFRKFLNFLQQIESHLPSRTQGEVKDISLTTFSSKSELLEFTLT